MPGRTGGKSYKKFCHNFAIQDTYIISRYLELVDVISTKNARREIMYIYSKWAERDLRSLDRHNCVAKLYELIGIYTSYQGDATIAKSMSFAQYYEECADEKRYHFKNIGECHVKARLPFVPRHDFRLLSRTYGGIPVISSSTNYFLQGHNAK